LLEGKLVLHQKKQWALTCSFVDLLRSSDKPFVHESPACPGF
jgi:hypothetical protein